MGAGTRLAATSESRTTMTFKVHTTRFESKGEAAIQGTTLEFSSLEDALFQAFLLLDAGEVVSSITGPEVGLTRDQIKRKWRAARQ